MAKSNIKIKAIALRKDGHSITEIAKQFSVSKSTVSLWCKNISLTEKQIRKIAEMSQHHATFALLKAAEAQRKKRVADIARSSAEGRALVGSLSKRDIFMVGLGLYWGEGYKKGSQELGFTNSDPAMVIFYIRWLTFIYNIAPSQLILRVSINSFHSKRVAEVVSFWSKLTGIPHGQFTKTSLIKTTLHKKYLPQESVHYGTLRIKVRNGTSLRRQILGSIEALHLNKD